MTKEARIIKGLKVASEISRQFYEYNNNRKSKPNRHPLIVTMEILL